MRPILSGAVETSERTRSGKSGQRRSDRVTPHLLRKMPFAILPGPDDRADVERDLRYVPIAWKQWPSSPEATTTIDPIAAPTVRAFLET